MPEIKLKHVVSFSSEDKVHKAENLIKPETYRKWKCATPGEQKATVVLQFEKATQIHSIDIGNEGSAFVEVLVGRSSDTVNEYQVLLVASSFMSPLESRNGTQINRVRMFGPDKLSQSTKNEKWDCAQIVCTQPFNKSISYGLTFIRFNSPPEKIDESPRNQESEKASSRLGAFTLKTDDEEEEDSPTIGSWFGKQKTQTSENSNSAADKAVPSYAASILASSSNASPLSSQNTTQKRKINYQNDSLEEQPAKKTPTTVLDKKHIIYKDVLRHTPESKKVPDTNGDLKKNTSSPKAVINKKAYVATTLNQSSSSSPVTGGLKKKVQFNKIMDKVVFVLSGFVNPLRSELRDKALEMGAKYKPDWDNTCTHLVCAFMNTPKYEQVKKLKGRIVSKEWILDCYKKKESIRWTKYMLGKLLNDSSSESDYKPDESESSDDEFTGELVDDDDDDDNTVKKKKKKPQTVFQQKKADSPKAKPLPSTPSTKIKSNSPKPKNPNIAVSKDQSSTPRKSDDSSIFTKIKQLNTSGQESISGNSNSSSPTVSAARGDSETEDEDAIQDYIADTDVDDSSGSDTEDEIRKVEMKMQKKAKDSKMNGLKEDPEFSEKPDVSNLPLPELPNLFKKKHFYLYGDFSSTKLHDMRRFITAYNGVIGDYMNDKIKYVITDEKWDGNFEAAVSENEDLIFVKPVWIYKCHEAGKLLPYQPYIVIPDS